MDRCNDNNLVVLLQKGDEQAFKLLFKKYSVRLYQFSLKYLKDSGDAEDLINDVFLNIWKNRQSLKSNLSFQSYLFTIAYNNIRQRFLKKSREEKYIRIFTEKYLVNDSQEEDKLDYISLVKMINETIEMLPPRRKEIFILSYKDELNNREIAEKIALSENFVRKQLSIARKFMVCKIKENDRFGGLLLICLFT